MLETYDRPILRNRLKMAIRFKCLFKILSSFYVLIKRGFDLLRFTKKGFLSYKNYADRMAFIDTFYFQQETRKQSIKNMEWY